MRKRRAPRTRKRLACSLLAQDGRSSGLILDLSAMGLFVQTGVKLDPGTAVGVEFEAPGSADTLRVECRVIWRKAAPARLKSVVQAGIGVEIEHAPEGFFAMVAALQQGGERAPSEKPAPKPPRSLAPRKKLSSPRSARASEVTAEQQPTLHKLRKRFKVEVHEVGGRGARIVEVEALNAAAAARKALAEVGDGWKVAGCEAA